jgi:hypothetical protein
VKGKINAPIKNNKIPKNAQWLGGIGSGSWFSIEQQKTDFYIKRFSENGDLECAGIFRLQKTGFDINNPYQFTYLSHCKMCTIIQNKTEYKLELITNED